MAGVQITRLSAELAVGAFASVLWMSLIFAMKSLTSVLAVSFARTGSVSRTATSRMAVFGAGVTVICLDSAAGSVLRFRSEITCSRSGRSVMSRAYVRRI